ncbi:hypothetical protein CLIB1444_01S02410 [[Candida] jaroonii]|uniref:Uncharacterized protein n=1 Tax=[Candida] jaroonii TaxID=467808 RepID=A0ACA9Y0E4_9ASCO|nr:hypothetical protein CLIB1444_01S02410 [[Candida] jaroonii]
MSKRNLDATEELKKKNIDELTQKLSLENNDWPIYNHPNGGIIKITPWGSIRQYESNGETITKFEDMNFSDYDFINLPLPYKNQVPQPQQNPFGRNLNTMSSMNSLSNNSDNYDMDYDGYQNDYELPQTPQSIRLSPSDEAENYVLKGYSDPNFQQEYSKEQENYFGMMDDIDDSNND